MSVMTFYVLVDPFTDEPRYVGKTHEGLEKRMYFHTLKETYLPSSKWIHEVLRKGGMPIAHELETVDINSDTQSVERFWVQYFRYLGADLTNIVFMPSRYLEYRKRKTRSQTK